MKVDKILLNFLLLLSLFAHGQNIVKESVAKIQSPNKKLTVEFYQKLFDKGNRKMYYQVHYDDKVVINESELDLQLDNNLSEKAMALPVDKHEKWFENLVVTNVKSSTKDTSWKPVVGEKSQIRDTYNSLTIETVKDDNPIYRLNIEMRAYNGGLALRYFFPENPKGTYKESSRTV